MSRRGVLTVLAVTLAVLVTACGPGGPASPPGGGDGARPEAVTDAGRLRGVVDGDVVRFRGVPYARPPVGPLRWVAPQPVAPASGVRDASSSGPACAQKAGQLPAPSLTEDCLYLDVTAPAGPGRDRPVMVWVHGGSLETGAGAQYDPRSLAAQGGVVVVTVNYRLGPLGFLALPGMDVTAGAQGLADQQEALRYVQRNAAAFGGDPGNVTVFGESGGGVSTCAHLIAPGSRGLFARAIVQSAVGACGDPIEPGAVGRDVLRTSNFQPRATVQAAGSAAAARLGCPDPTTAAACLRGVPTERLLAEGAGLNLPAYGGPGAILPTGPAAAIAAGRVAPVPVLQGFTSQEPSYFLAAETLAGRPLPPAREYEDLVRRSWGGAAGRILAEYPAARFRSPADAWVAVHADAGWACPSMRLNTELAARGRVYGYEFSNGELGPLPAYPPGLTPGATHGAEIGYLFDVPAAPGAPPPPALTPDQQRLSRETIRAWTAFARTGDPGTPAWTGTDRRLAVFGGPGREYGVSVVDVRAAHRCELWDGL